MFPSTRRGFIGFLVLSLVVIVFIRFGMDVFMESVTSPILHTVDEGFRIVSSIALCVVITGLLLVQLFPPTWAGWEGDSS